MTRWPLPGRARARGRDGGVAAGRLEAAASERGGGHPARLTQARASLGAVRLRKLHCSQRAKGAWARARMGTCSHAALLGSRSGGIFVPRSSHIDLDQLRPTAATQWPSPFQIWRSAGQTPCTSAKCRPMLGHLVPTSAGIEPRLAEFGYSGQSPSGIRPTSAQTCCPIRASSDRCCLK